MADTVSVQVNGRHCRVAEGTSVAAAVFEAGQCAFRHSVTGQTRAPLCGMGICFECRVTINQRRHLRSCQLPVEEGMVIETE
ncbi:MAG: (2Fe-2S)-binding protein [Acidobacteriaceae bacterium]|nr:(2Fe-2S)-binding protein [Acidobacteriaceae bacterium]MBV9443522.1 (2Fe-2S)-binding protein [Acidobacteriaceae bacterium]